MAVAEQTVTEQAEPGARAASRAGPGSPILRLAGRRLLAAIPVV